MNNSLFSLVEDLVKAEETYKEINISGIKTDSKKVLPGDLFIAVNGNNFDGHDFIDEAKRSGAVAAMTSRPVDTDLPTLVVADTRRSLGQLASYWRGQFDIPMIAVTGSNGKTTVKEMMASIEESDIRTVDFVSE